MGLLRHKDDQPVVRFRMREKLPSIGDDYWVEDDAGNKVYKVDGKALRIRETFHLLDAAGEEVAEIKEKKLAIRDTMTIKLPDREAKVHKRLIGIRDRYIIDFDAGDDFTAKGNFVDHEYEIEREGDKVAQVSKKWFRIRDTYGVELHADQDPALILAITVCIDEMARRLDK